MNTPEHEDISHAHRKSGVLAVVLARACSKGVPGKNSTILAGKPCIAWTIEHAREAQRVDTVLVSTDSPEIYEIASSMGVLVHHRPAALATDHARVDDALRDAVAWFETHKFEARESGPASQCSATPISVRTDAVVMLYGNVPVRPAGLVDRAVELLEQTGCDSVQSYAAVGKYNPLWQVRIDKAGKVEPWQGDALFGNIYRRQELPQALVPDGGVVAMTRDVLFCVHIEAGHEPSPHSFLGLDHRGITNPEGAVVDIDSPIDLVVADAILTQQAKTQQKNTTQVVSC